MRLGQDNRLLKCCRVGVVNQSQLHVSKPSERNRPNCCKAVNKSGVLVCTPAITPHYQTCPSQQRQTACTRCSLLSPAELHEVQRSLTGTRPEGSNRSAGLLSGADTHAFKSVDQPAKPRPYSRHARITPTPNQQGTIVCCPQTSTATLRKNNATTQKRMAQGIPSLHLPYTACTAYAMHLVHPNPAQPYHKTQPQNPAMLPPNEAEM